MLKFKNPAKSELPIYEAVARKLYNHHVKSSAGPVCGISVDYGNRSVSLYYRKLTGEEIVPGQKYDANAVKTQYIGDVLDALRLIKDSGLAQALKECL